MKVLYFLLIVLYSNQDIASDPYEKKIFIESISSSKGKLESISAKIKKILSFKLHSELSDKFTFIDPDFVSDYNSALSKNKDGCAGASCMEWMIKHFSPTHKLYGNLELSTIKMKLTLTLEDIINNKIISEKQIFLPMNDYDYDVGVLLVSLLDPNRIILDSQSISNPPKLDIQPISLKSIAPLNQYTELRPIPSPKETEILLNREYILKNGDFLFEKSDYYGAFQEYKKVLDDPPPLELKKKYKKYFEGEKNNLSFRITNSYYNSIAVSIQKLDLSIQGKTNLTVSNEEALKLKYKNILDSLGDETPYNKELRELLIYRIESLEYSKNSALEINAENLFKEGKLKEALKEYINLKSSIGNNPLSSIARVFKTRADEKIQKILLYNKKYSLNGAVTYCSLIERKHKEFMNTPDNQDKKINEFRYKEAIRTTTDFFKKISYIDEDGIKYCNNAFSLAFVQLDEVIQDKSKIVTNDKSNVAEIKKGFDFRKLSFPGHFRMVEDGSTFKSNFLFYGGITSFISTLAIGGVLAQRAVKYNSQESISPLYFLGGQNLYTYSIYNDIQTENAYMTAYNSTKVALTASGAVFGGFYLYSLIDAFLVGKKTPAEINLLLARPKQPGSSFQFNIQTVPLSKREIENQIQVGYEYNF